MLQFNATLLAQIVDFLILLVFLRLVAYKPLVKLLEERRQRIADAYVSAEESRKQAQDLKSEMEAEMRKLRQDAQVAVDRAVKAGQETGQEIIAAARAEAERIKEGARTEIRREKEKAVVELRNSVASLSVAVAEKVIRQSLEERVQHQMVDKFIDEAGGLLRNWDAILVSPTVDLGEPA